MIPAWLARGCLCLLLTLLIIWPTIATVIEATRDDPNAASSGRGLIAPISDDAIVRPARLAARTLELVALTELLALPLGIAFALLLFRTDLWGRKILLAAFGLMALVPMPLHATAWLGGFGNLGRSQALGSDPILRGMTGAAFVHAIAALPWIVGIVGVGLLSVERELEDAARLEVSPARALLSVTLRRTLGAIAGAALAVAVLTASDMTVTDLLSVRTYAEEAYLQFQIGQGPASAATVALPPLIVLGILLFLGGRSVLRFDPARLASVARRPHVWKLGSRRLACSVLVFLGVGLLVGLPLYSLVWRAGRVGGDAAVGLAPHWSFSGLLGSVAEGWKAIWPPTRSLLRKPLAASLVWSGLAAGISTGFAWTLAWASRASRVWKVVALVALAIALAAPGPVVGMALVLAYRSVPILYNTAGIVVLAGVARVWPYAFLILWPAVRGIPREYLEAAALDGLTPLQTVRKVAIPLTSAAILAAWSVSYLLTLGELPASGLVAPPGLTTLPALVWGALHIGVESRLAAIALLLWAGFIVTGLLCFGLVGVRSRRVRAIARRGPG